MDLAYAASDVIVSRAGASSVSELALVSKPVLLSVSECRWRPQTKNAMALVNKMQPSLLRFRSKKTITRAIIDLIEDESKQKQLRENIGKLH